MENHTHSLDRPTMKPYFILLSTLLCISGLTSCQKNPQMFDVIGQSRSLATAIQQGNFDPVKSAYEGTTVRPGQLDSTLQRIHGFVKAETFPEDSLFWLDTVIVEEPHSMSLLCSFPVSPARLSPVPEGYFYFSYDLFSKALIGFNYSSNRIAQAFPNFAPAKTIEIKDKGIKEIALIEDGGYANPTVLKQTRINFNALMGHHKRDELFEFFDVLEGAAFTVGDDIYSNKKFKGNPVMQILYVELNDGNRYSIFNLEAAEPGKAEVHMDKLRIFHYKNASSCYEYLIDKQQYPRLEELMKMMCSSAREIHRSVPVAVMRPYGSGQAAKSSGHAHEHDEHEH